MSKLNIWDFKKHPVLRGTYASLFMGMGKWKTMVYHIREEKNQKIVSIWGHYQIKLFLSWQPIGTKIEIKSLGLKKKKKKDGKTSRYFEYKCRVLAPAPKPPKEKAIIGKAGGRGGDPKATKRP
jgi:hypothetical protein